MYQNIFIIIHPYTKRIIGITDKQLIKLIENAQKVEDKKRQAIPSEEKRLIKAGGGRKKSLGKAEEIILTLYYLHHVPTFQLLGAIFGVSESTANNIFQALDRYFEGIITIQFTRGILGKRKQIFMDKRGFDRNRI